MQDLHAGYGNAEVLSGLNLKLAQGQVVTVIGPNGAGKSTTLNALMGVLGAKGRIVFDGEDLAGVSLEERVMKGLALVPEKRELFATMPVEDNLVLGAWRQMRLKNGAWRDELERVYQLFPRLKERRTQLAGTLSGGERQMLAVGRALMSKPKLLMLDEPSLGLAPLVVREIFRIVERLREAGVSILLIEQNARAALEVADYGYVLETACDRAGRSGRRPRGGRACDRDLPRRQEGLSPRTMSALPRHLMAAPTGPAELPSRVARPRGLSQGLLADIVGYRIVQARLTTGASFDRHIGQPLGLRPVEYTLLILLKTNGQASPKQLATALALSAPNLTILLDRTQQRGLIARERSEADRRSQIVRLTPEGQALTETAEALTPAMEADLDNCLSRAERALLLELLDKVARNRRVD